jgi:CTP-dependent riboflavin kinase
VLIAGRYRGIVFQGDEPEYPPTQVDIMSDHHLRATRELHDGDTLAFALVTDQCEGMR